MLMRIVTGVGLFALGYYLGKEVQRTRPARDELAEARRDAATPDPAAAPVKNEDPVT